MLEGMDRCCRPEELFLPSWHKDSCDGYSLSTPRTTAVLRCPHLHALSVVSLPNIILLTVSPTRTCGLVSPSTTVDWSIHLIIPRATALPGRLHATFHAISHGMKGTALGGDNEYQHAVELKCFAPDTTWRKGRVTTRLCVVAKAQKAAVVRRTRWLGCQTEGLYIRNYRCFCYLIGWTGDQRWLRRCGLLAGCR